jgi:PAS domain-containing protein
MPPTIRAPRTSSRSPCSGHCCRIGARYALRGAKASEQLREAQARNNAILDAIPDMIFTLTATAVYIDCRAGMHEVEMLPFRQPVGRNVSELLPPELAERFRLGIRSALDERRTQTLFYSLAQPSASTLRGADRALGQRPGGGGGVATSRCSARARRTSAALPISTA